MVNAQLSPWHENIPRLYEDGGRSHLLRNKGANEITLAEDKDEQIPALPFNISLERAAESVCSRSDGLLLGDDETVTIIYVVS